jgi:hypothetical protein
MLSGPASSANCGKRALRPRKYGTSTQSSQPEAPRDPAQVPKASLEASFATADVAGVDLGCEQLGEVAAVSCPVVGGRLGQAGGLRPSGSPQPSSRSAETLTLSPNKLQNFSAHPNAP